MFCVLLSIWLGAPLGLCLIPKICFSILLFSIFYFFVGCSSWDGFWILVFCVLLSIWLGAPLGLCLIPKKLFSILLFSIFYFFRGLFFLGWILEFSFLFSTFYLVGGSPRPVSYTQKTFFDFTVF